MLWNENYILNNNNNLKRPTCYPATVISRTRGRCLVLTCSGRIIIWIIDFFIEKLIKRKLSRHWFILSFILCFPNCEVLVVWSSLWKHKNILSPSFLQDVGAGQPWPGTNTNSETQLELKEQFYNLVENFEIIFARREIFIIVNDNENSFFIIVYLYNQKLS